MERKKILVYLGITIGITYGCWWFLAVASQLGILSFGEGTFMILYLLGGFGPTIGAILTVVLLNGKEGLSEFKSQVFKARVKWYWYIATFSVFFIQSFLIILIYVFLFGYSPDREIMPLYLILPSIPVMIIGGGLEELGWRGIAQPELQKSQNATISTILLAIIWGFWHLPLFYIIGVNQYKTNFGVFLVMIFPISFILAWIYNNTESIFLCILTHAFYNSLLEIGWLFYNYGFVNTVVAICVSYLLMALLICIFGYKTLTKTSKLYPEPQSN